MYVILLMIIRQDSHAYQTSYNLDALACKNYLTDQEILYYCIEGIAEKTNNSELCKELPQTQPRRDYCNKR